MKIERLRNKKSKLIFLCGFLMVVILLVTLIFKGSKAKYRNSNIIPLINTKVKNNVPDFTVMGIYLNDGGPITGKDGKKYTKQPDTYTMPSSDYVINEANSYCTLFNKDTNTNEEVTKTNNPELKLYTDILGNHSIKGIKKGYKCHLFFDIGSTKPLNIDTFLLLSWGYKDLIRMSEITERTDFDKVRTDGGNKVYKAPDDYGTSYYLVGNPKNNWVKFAGYYWRIVRINGNGSIRMIYSGSELTGPGTSEDFASIGRGSFNEDFTMGEYVGYMYTMGSRQGYSISSSAKNILDNFYDTKLKNYSNYIDKNIGFCNDRSVINGPGIGTDDTDFGAKKRLVETKSPVLTCPEKDYDLFTVTGASIGNKKLTYPIGLITADEVYMSGNIYGGTANTENLFYTKSLLWTMTPVDVSHYAAWGYRVSNVITLMYGVLTHSSTGGEYNIKPVINLVKTVTFSKGNGSISSPFEI